MFTRKKRSGILACIKSNRRITDSGIYVFLEPDSLPVDRSLLEKLVQNCKKNKIDCIIPCLGSACEPSGRVFALIGELYGELLSIASERGVKVGLAIDRLIEESFFCEDSPVPQAQRDALSSRILNQRQYYCAESERVEMELPSTLMSVTAYDEENATSCDISEYIRDGRLEYTAPQGNWVVNAYTCDCENILGQSGQIRLNKMSYDCSRAFLSTVVDLLGDNIKKHFGKTLSLIYMTDICFDSPNRRNWDESFNEKFVSEYGFDPKAHYNCLFYSVGERTPHLKSLFMNCRAKMLREGIFAALSDFAKENSLELVSGMVEPKLADCSWLTGDALANFEGSACALLDKAYMYGLNSLHLASAANQNYSTGEVYCELYRDYYKMSPDIAYKDAINAYSKGCTRLLAHSKHSIDNTNADYKNQAKKLSELSSRCRQMLSGGTSISDIAILYPSYSMHSEIYLYQTKEDGFEYPNILPYNDHMTVINMLSSYCGQNATLIHPETMRSSCSVKGKKLRLSTQHGTNDFRVLILPGISVIDTETLELIKDFYDNGGKIIATGRLPHYSAQFHPDHEHPDDEFDFMHVNEYATELDEEVRDTVAYIFGSETSIKSKLREYYSNCNSKGGEAYFLCASKTTSDGTLFCNEHLLRSILYSMELPLDVYMNNLPDQLGYDCLNDIYPNFSRLGLNAAFPGGGLVSHVHKKRDGENIYFFSNTTNYKYQGHVFLKGMLTPSAIEAETGKSRRVSYRYVGYNNEVYTAIRLALEPSCAIFILSPEDASPRKKVQSIPKIISIEYNFLTE